ncbi:hypothetical protein [Hominenteromicrobium sp.]|uniref:hypothetical protein n=1 Tax=Hominenteromicrobium sp. TaxID=3073581 RepID=UPI00399AD99D
MVKKTKREISLEEYLYYYSIAYKRNNAGAINQLCDRYPELLKQAIDYEDIKKRESTIDFEICCRHPIVANTARMTERRVLDMVAYLFYNHRAPNERAYRTALKNSNVSVQRVFNYSLDRWQTNYNRKELWENYFLQVEELKKRLESQKIGSIEELEYRAAEYFNRVFSCQVGGE